MTYTVSSGTLNSTIPYHTIPGTGHWSEGSLVRKLYSRGAPAFPTLAIETIWLGLGIGLGIAGVGIAGVGITGVGIAVCTHIVVGLGLGLGLRLGLGLGLVRVRVRVRFRTSAPSDQ